MREDTRLHGLLCDRFTTITSVIQYILIEKGNPINPIKKSHRESQVSRYFTSNEHDKDRNVHNSCPAYRSIGLLKHPMPILTR